MFAQSSNQLHELQSNTPHSHSRIIIDQKYLLKRLTHKYSCFNVYEGIDFKASRFVTVYIKPGNVDHPFSKKIKEQLRNKVSPPLLWSGTHKIQKVVYHVQVHQKYGPSFKSMFNYIKTPISQRDFLLLMYQFIRLVEKYGTVGYVYRELDMEHIIFDAKPEKNDLYLLNVFSLKKKGEETQVMNTRFCSRGAHLGLKSYIKDDLESICYILLNIHMQGDFLRNVPSEEYAESKANIDLNSFKRPLPSLFLDFYSYVLNLNYSDEVNYFKWRNVIYRAIGKEAIVNPFEWMMAKAKENSSDSVIEFGTHVTHVTQIGGETEVDEQELQEEMKPADKVLMERLKRSEVLSNCRR